MRGAAPLARISHQFLVRGRRDPLSMRGRTLSSHLDRVCYAFPP